MEDLEIFSFRLRETREKYHWSQAELARKASITPAAINQFEKGSRMPNLPILRKLAITLEVSIDYLTGRSNQENEPRVQQEWKEFYRGFKELSEKDRDYLKSHMEFLKKKSHSNE